MVKLSTPQRYIIVLSLYKFGRESYYKMELITKRQLHSGERVTFDGCNGTFRFVCCACGLSHDISFNVIDGKLSLSVNVNARSTSQFRRHMKPNKETLEALIGNYAKEK